MKRAFSVLINVLPFFAWMYTFYIQYTSDKDGHTILMLLAFPILLSVFNYKVSKTKKELILRNCLFAFSHIAGYFIHGVLWYKLVSSDSETAYITVVLSRESLIYIFVITLILYFIKKHKEKKSN